MEKTYTIVKRGRKWYEGQTLEGYKAQIEINEISNNWQVGESYTFNCKVEVKEYRGHKSFKIYPQSEQAIAQEKEVKTDAEFARWQGYVANKAPEGYLYIKGIEKMQELKSGTETDNLIEEYRKIADTANACIQGRKWLGYIENNLAENKWYYKGEEVVIEKISILEQLKPEKATEFKAQLSELKNKYKAQKTTEKALAPWRIGKGEGYGGSPYYQGDVIRTPKRLIEDGAPEFLYVIKTSQEYFSEDGMSFGVGDESGYIYYADCREAMPEEYASLLELEHKKAEEKAAQQELQKIKEYIRENGEKPEGMNTLEGKRLFDTQNIYGGGDWFIVGKNYIWYVRNNGADGDCWEVNNVETAGAGAIGWRIPTNSEIIEKLNRLTVILSK